MSNSTPFRQIAPYLPRPAFTMNYRAHPVDRGRLAETGGLVVTPPEGLDAEAYENGPGGLCIDPGTKVYTLTNTSDHSIDWTATLSAGMDTYFTLSAASGTLAAGGVTTVTVELVAAGTPPESVSGSVLFNNVTDVVPSGTRTLTALIGLQPQITNVAYESAARYAALCGYSEFTDATVPPKKYLTKICAGQVLASYHTPTDCTGPVTAWTGQKYSGQTSFDPNTCTEVPGVSESIYPPTAAPFDPVNWGAPSIVADMNFPGKEATACLDCTTTRIYRFAVGNDSCDTCYSFPAPQKVAPEDCMLSETLANEDTEAAAWARSTTTYGTLNTASKHMVRTGGEFDFGETSVEYTISLDQLLAGITYTIRLSFSIVPIGGGDTVNTTEDITVFATGTTQDVVGTFTAAEGFEKTLDSVDFYCASSPPLSPGP